MHNVNDGHRLEYALFNTALRRIACDKGGIVHTNTNQTVLTKQDLLDLCETQANLVHRVASLGAEIRATSMFWKREARHLEWRAGCHRRLGAGRTGAVAHQCHFTDVVTRRHIRQNDLAATNVAWRRWKDFARSANELKLVAVTH